MAKGKSPSELNSKVIRINIGIYQLLAELAAKHGLTMAEALDQLVTGRARREELVVPRTQIPMPVFRVTPVTSIAVNGAGAKHSAFKIKPKGGVIHD